MEQKITIPTKSITQHLMAPELILAMVSTLDSPKIFSLKLGKRFTKASGIEESGILRDNLDGSG